MASNWSRATYEMDIRRLESTGRFPEYPYLEALQIAEAWPQHRAAILGAATPERKLYPAATESARQGPITPMMTHMEMVSMPTVHRPDGSTYYVSQEQLAGSPGSYYGDSWADPVASVNPREGGSAGDYTGTTLAVGPAAAGAIVLLSRVLPAVANRFPSLVISTVRSTIIRANGQWSRMPGWLQGTLTSIGIAVGTTIVLDNVTDGELMPGFGDGMPSPADESVSVSKTWTANGVPMALLSDGRMAAWSERKRRWKFWRPKKPIVLYATGAQDLNTVLRANTALDRQAKRLKKLVDRDKVRTRQVCFRCGNPRSSCHCH